MKRKMIDENGRLFGLISVIDVVVIAVVAVSALALYTKFNATPIVSPSVTMDTIKYQIYITNMPQGRLDSLRVGDAVYDGDNDTGNPVGTITDILVEDCVIPSVKQDGTYVMATADERYNVTLDITAAGTVDKEGRVYLNRTTEVGNGSSISYYTKACLFNGAVIGLE